MKVEVKRGNLVRFWEETWGGSSSFSLCFPSFCQLSSCLNKPINFFLPNSDLGCNPSGWNFISYRNLRDGKIQELSELLECLNRVLLRG